MQLQGGGAIVTVGASGLGAATAKELAKAGAKVAIFDMNLDLAEQTAKEIGGVAIKCDVADGPGGEAAVKEAIAKVGPVRVLVNCAGVGTPMKAVGKDGPVALEKFVKVVQINLRSEEHTSELQSLMRISYAVFCLKKKKNTKTHKRIQINNINLNH